MTPYSGVVLEHFRRPRNQRALAAPSASHEAFNPLCGDRVRVEVRVERDAVGDAAFASSACAICTAAASLLTERVIGASVHDARAITSADIVRLLGVELPAARLACASLPLTALHQALAMRNEPVGAAK